MNEIITVGFADLSSGFKESMIDFKCEQTILLIRRLVNGGHVCLLHPHISGSWNLLTAFCIPESNSAVQRFKGETHTFGR